MDNISNNMALSSITSKVVVSARVNSYLVEQYKKSEIPISLVIESSLVHFMKLNDTEKIKFLSSNLPEKVKIGEIKTPKEKWKDILLKYLNKLDIPSSLISGLFTGLCIGAVALIGGVLAAIDDKQVNDI